MFERLIDWIDVRLGVKGFYRDHIAFTMPEHWSFWTYFGGLTIGCIVIQVITGIYMASYYVPVPDLAHESIKSMCNEATFGAIFRNVHRWSSTFGVFFLVIHMFHIIAKKAYRAPREINWWIGLFMGFLFFLLLITGIIVPWDWRSYWELIIWADWVDNIPLLGSYLKGPMLKYFTLGRNYIAHVFILPTLLFGALLIHIILERRLGLSDRV